MDIKDTAAAISDMRIRGAGRIARAGASALSEFAAGYNGKDIASFRSDLKDAAGTLLESRPTAVSLWNGVQSTLKGVNDASSVGEAAELMIRNSEEFIRHSEKAVEIISRIGAKRIKDGDSVLTHCNSSAALGTIIEAHRQGKRIKVYSTESRPWRQGILTCNGLAASGLDTTLIIDSAVRAVMKDIDIVIVGADTVTAHGTLINKIGTSQIALAANEARVPFVVCTETYKFSPMTLFGDMVKIEERDCSEIIGTKELPPSVKIFNPVFDATPAKYIDAIITEVGMLHPASVHDVMIRQFGENIFDLMER